GVAVEEVRRRVRELVRRPIEIVRAVGGVDQVAQRNLVRNHEDRGLWALHELSEGLGVAAGGVVERLPAGERIAARALALPRPVLLERLAFEVAHVDVVEQRLDLERDAPALEGDRSRFARS